MIIKFWYETFKEVTEIVLMRMKHCKLEHHVNKKGILWVEKLDREIQQMLFTVFEVPSSFLGDSPVSDCQSTNSIKSRSKDLKILIPPRSSLKTKMYILVDMTFSFCITKNPEDKLTISHKVCQTAAVNYF